MVVNPCSRFGALAISVIRGADAELVGRQRCMSRIPAAANHKAGGSKNQEDSSFSGTWLPHPRTGIYFPKGHEWVMNDVPNDAATFPQTIWLRNADGSVDHKLQEEYSDDTDSPHYNARRL